MVLLLHNLIESVYSAASIDVFFIDSGVYANLIGTPFDPISKYAKSSEALKSSHLSAVFVMFIIQSLSCMYTGTE